MLRQYVRLLPSRVEQGRGLARLADITETFSIFHPSMLEARARKALNRSYAASIAQPFWSQATWAFG